MTDSAHLSIGEVLALVQADFPDVTISKIRFLESQGLLDPERTPSGYRKFHHGDIERLQWILGQQRDNFLPLKVIRDRLDEWDVTGTPPHGDAEVDHPSNPTPPVADTGPSPDLHPAPAETAPAVSPSDAAPAETGSAEIGSPDHRTASASLAAGSAMEVLPSRRPLPDPPAPSANSGPDRHARSVGSVGSVVSGASDPGEVEPPFTAAELAERAGVSVEVVAELESYSMIESRRKGSESYYDIGAVAVTEACQHFLEQGVEVRHLRMYKIAAEREAGMFEQLVVPLLKQRNPEARARALDMIESLSEAGESMHAALLRQALRDTLP